MFRSLLFVFGVAFVVTGIYLAIQDGGLDLPEAMSDQTGTSRLSFDQNQTQDQVMDNTATVSPTPVPRTDAKTLAVPDMNLMVVYPQTYTLTESTEANRRGSDITLVFKEVSKVAGGSLDPVFMEIGFFNLQNLPVEVCVNVPCPQVRPPTKDDYLGLKLALENEDVSRIENVTGQNLDAELLTFNQRQFVVRTIDTNDGAIREYIALEDDTLVITWIGMPSIGSTLETEEQLNARADELFSEFELLATQS